MTSEELVKRIRRVRTERTDDDDKKKSSRGVKLFIRDIILIFVAALLISFLIKTFLIRSF